MLYLYFSVSSEPLGPGQSTEYRENDKMYIWKLKKIDGGTEEQLIMKVSTSCPIQWPYNNYV